MTLRQLSSSALGRTAFLRLSTPVLWTSFTRSATTVSTSVYRDRSPGHQQDVPQDKRVHKKLQLLHWPGIEPGPPAWQARILPLNHQCQMWCIPPPLPHGPAPSTRGPAGTGTAGCEPPQAGDPQQALLMPGTKPWERLFLPPQISPPANAGLSLAFRVNALMTRPSKARALLGGAVEPAPWHRTTATLWVHPGHPAVTDHPQPVPKCS